MVLRASPRPFLVIALVLGVASQALAAPRTAKAAGSFYPDDPKALGSMVDALLGRHEVRPEEQNPLILILPHAGYAYSGAVAAKGFRTVQGQRYDGVVVVGFTHRQTFPGVSVDDREAYETPLGLIPVDQAAVAFLRAQPGFIHEESAHASDEHSLEVMLPFLQVALEGVPLVPILMGSADDATARALAQALARLAGRGRYLFVFSTDLSHYHPESRARFLDEVTIGAIVFEESAKALDRLFEQGRLEACGRGPILAAARLAERLGYPSRRQLLYANSGDATGDKSSVVGYAAVGMYARPTEAAPRLSEAAGRELVAAARSTLTAHLTGQPTPANALPSLSELESRQGMFVTLRKHGQLRGCMGRVESDQPLRALVSVVALQAALQDPRFAPLSADELKEVTIEVSVLSPLRSIRSAEDIVPGRDGVVLRKGDRMGVFLPAVWEESGWTRTEFLRALAQQKAGLGSEEMREVDLVTFSDHVFEEGDVSPDLIAH